MKNTFKSLLVGASLPLSFVPLSSKGQTFMPTSPSIIETTFPYSYSNYPTGSHTPTVPAPLDFYYNRTGGSAYHNTTDAFGTDLDIYLWGYSHDLLDGYGAGVAYRITTPGDSVTQFRGLNSIGSDFAEVQVGMFRSNSKVYVVSFNWSPGAGPALNFWDLLPTTDGLVPSSGTGGAPPAVQNVAPAWAPGVHSQHLAMDSHDMNCFAIAWEAPGIGVFVRAYRVNSSGVLEQSSGPGSLTGFPDLMLPSNSLRLPDLAITHDPGSGKRIIQLAAVDTALLQIDEFAIDLDMLFTAPSFSVEDVNPISKFNSGWDEFQLSIDAPDHFTPAGLRNSWSYTYYNNDNNNINVRVCDGNVSPATFSSYVVNNGSLGNQSINNSGNAFPTIAYDKTGNELYVGWYTTYDPAAVGLPLYNYVTPASSVNGGRRYVCVKMTTGGVITSLNDYMDVQSDYLNNWIGMVGFGRPGITFSKHNDGTFLFTTYNHHGQSYEWFQTSSYAGVPYVEGFDCSTTLPPSGPYISSSGFSNNLFYQQYLSCFCYLNPLTPSFEARVINHKLIPWSSSSFFAPTKISALNPAEKIAVKSNPFSEGNPLILTGGVRSELLSVSLVSLEGKELFSASGSLEIVNQKIKNDLQKVVPSGTYILNVKRAGGSIDRFKVVKI